MGLMDDAKRAAKRSADLAEMSDAQRIDRLRAEFARSLDENKRVRKDYEIVTAELAEARCALLASNDTVLANKKLQEDNATKDARIAHWENLGAGTSDAYTPDLGPEEKIVWILGDMMNAVENQFGVENAKRLGHIHCCADRLLREVIDPKDARIAELEAWKATCQEVDCYRVSDDRAERAEAELKAMREAIRKIRATDNITAVWHIADGALNPPPPD